MIDHLLDSLKYETAGTDTGELVESFDRSASGVSIDIGRAAELLVASDLEFQGYKVTLAGQMCSYDLLVDTGSQILRVQVKATSGPYKWNNNNKASKYRFKLQRGGGNVSIKKTKRKDYDPSEVDMFALVACDIRKIAYIPVVGKITNTMELYPTHNNRRSTSKVITDYPFNKALNQLNKAYQPLVNCGDECSTQNQTASHQLNGEQFTKEYLP